MSLFDQFNSTINWVLSSNRLEAFFHYISRLSDLLSIIIFAISTFTLITVRRYRKILVSRKFKDNILKKLKKIKKDLCSFQKVQSPSNIPSGNVICHIISYVSELQRIDRYNKRAIKKRLHGIKKITTINEANVVEIINHLEAIFAEVEHE